MMRKGWVILSILLIVSMLAGGLAIAAKKPNPPAKPSLPRIVEFGSASCIPCKMMVSVLNELAKEYKDKLVVVIVDVEKFPEKKKKYRVRMIPTQILYNTKGEEIARHQGYWPKEDIIAEFKKHGIDLKKGNQK